MSTKTMRLPPRRVVTPSNKRKEEEDGIVDTVQMPKKPKPAQSQAVLQMEPAAADSAAASNQLLAGYFAYEFLTKGTLFGKPFDAALAESSSAAGSSQELWQRREEEAEKIGGAEPGVDSLQRYVAVADLLGSDGAHLAGVFNPTQLARLLQL